MAYLRTVVWITFFLLLVSSSSFSADRTFRGKVIDAETLEPMEGALVLAVWRESRGTIAGADTRFKDAKETLTDKNGEWTIVGPEGYEDKIILGLIHLMGVFVTREPEFVIYKPGYVKYWTAGCFVAYPYVDKEHGLEGIVLRRPGVTREERKKFYEKYKEFLPFISLKNPEKKLRDLEFSFEYPENVRKVGWRREIEVFKVYTVVGLKKAKTREERLDATPSPPTDDMEKLPLLYKLINQEHKRFGLKTYKRRAK